MSDREEMARRMLANARTPQERARVEAMLRQLEANPVPGPTYEVNVPEVHYDEAQTAQARRLRAELERLPPEQQRAAYERMMRAQENPRPGPTYTVDARPVGPADAAAVQAPTAGRDDEAMAERRAMQMRDDANRARAGGSGDAQRVALERMARERYER